MEIDEMQMEMVRPSSKIAVGLTNPYFCLALRLFLGGVLIYAGAAKLFDMPGMARAIANYRLLPDSLVNIVAMILPPVELLAGIGLILGLCFDGALAITTLLLLVFLAAIESAILRGLDIQCGCFGTSDAELVGTGVLLRDAMLLLAVIPLWMDKNARFRVGK
ncbi:MAG: MauE/DoxX family redox-associated membrane protein [Candidatus Omnitrophota bacterium]